MRVEQPAPEKGHIKVVHSLTVGDVVKIDDAVYTVIEVDGEDVLLDRPLETFGPLKVKVIDHVKPSDYFEVPPVFLKTHSLEEFTVRALLEKGFTQVAPNRFECPDDGGTLIVHHLDESWLWSYESKGQIREEK